MTERKLAVLRVELGSRAETQSGLQMLAPKIYGAYEEPARPGRTAAIVMHPTSNFMGHYLIPELSRRGVCCLGLNSRYAGNDATLLMERVLADLGAGVRFLKGLGYERVVLVGNSGGAALVSFYQAEAEHPRLLSTPAGDAVDVGELIPADGIVLCAAHAGRSRIMAEWIDPSVLDEHDPLAVDPQFDIYGSGPKPPFSADFVAAFRAAQLARRGRIEARATERLAILRSRFGPGADEALVVHRTHADPRMIDLSLDPNDRPPGSIWGDPKAVNLSANAVGRYSTLTSFLSQWASVSQADGPANLARTSTPVLFFDHTADASTFPSTARAWTEACAGRVEAHVLRGGNHYLAGQPELVAQLADTMTSWCAELP